MAAAELTLACETEQAENEPWTIEVCRDWAGAQSFWNAIRHKAASPFSSQLWAEAWFQAQDGNPAARPMLVLARRPDGLPALLLPAVERRHGPFRILECPAHKHAAYPSALFARQRPADGPDQGDGRVWRLLARALPGVDAVVFHGVREADLIPGHPLHGAKHNVQMEASFRCRLTQDWDSLYAAKTTSKSRANDRRCERRLAEHGELAFKVAATSGERRHFMGILLDQKSASLREDRLCDVFGDERVRQFYLKLAEADRTYLSALLVDDEPVAVNLGTLHGDCFHGLVLARDTGEISRYGPGRILLRMTIEDVARKGVAWIDFGVGAGRFKDTWADELIARRNIVVPLNTPGHLYARAMTTFFNAKTQIKASPLLWSRFNRYRRYLGC